MQSIAKKIYQTLQNARQIVIVPHQNPDGDATGSASALAECLKINGQKSRIFCLTPVPEKLRFLRHAETFSSDENVLTDPKNDVVVVLDSSDLRYAGIHNLLDNHRAKIINIDHHNTNEQFGSLNMVAPTAAATAEVLFHFFWHNRLAINRHCATALLTGIITDTGNFSNSATTTAALLIAGELLRRGGDYNLIHEKTLKNKSVKSLRLWGVVLKRLTKIEELDLTYTYTTQKDLAELGADDSEAEGIANFLNNLDNARATLLLRETADHKIKGSFRTASAEIDVSQWAQKLGGGGHKKAAGFTVDGTIEEALNKILTIKQI